MLNWVELYLDKVNILLNFIRFQRTGNWEGFLHALKKFILFFFALNQDNYARNLSYHNISMLNLHESHPSIFKYLKIVGFTASFSGLPFSETPCDRIIETIINRSSQVVFQRKLKTLAQVKSGWP